MNIFRANHSASTQSNSVSKNLSVTRLLTFAAIAVFGLASASEASAACSGAPTLNGRYSLTVSGGTKTSVNKFLNGTLTFDSSCNATGIVSIGENNVVYNFTSVVGSYTTNADGTLALTLSVPGVSSSETYDIGYSPLFGEALGIETDGNAYATIDLKPQVATVVKSTPVTSYNNATIKGNWVSMCSAGSPGLTDMNYFSVDGSTSYYGTFGNWTGTDHNYLGGFSLLNSTSHYAVMADGSFGGSTAAGSFALGFTGSIANNGNELIYNVIYGTGVVEACIAKRVS